MGRTHRFARGRACPSPGSRGRLANGLLSRSCEGRVHLDQALFEDLVGVVPHRRACLHNKMSRKKTTRSTRSKSKARTRHMTTMEVLARPDKRCRVARRRACASRSSWVPRHRTVVRFLAWMALFFKDTKSACWQSVFPIDDIAPACTKSLCLRHGRGQRKNASLSCTHVRQRTVTTHHAS